MQRLVNIFAILAIFVLGAGLVYQSRQDRVSQEELAAVMNGREQFVKQELLEQLRERLVRDEIHLDRKSDQVDLDRLAEAVADDHERTTRDGVWTSAELNRVADQLRGPSSANGGLWQLARTELAGGHRDNARLLALLAMNSELGEGNIGCRRPRTVEMPAWRVPEELRPFFTEGAGYVITGTRVGAGNYGGDVLQIRVDAFVPGC